VARPSGLGRGLGALIPNANFDADGTTDPVVTSGGAALADIAVSAIAPNPNQPRVHFDETSLNDLADSIREIGVLQPVLVRALGDGRYQLVAGERRWRAAQRAGLASVPAVIRVTDDMASVEQALVENLHRQDLTALEEAAAFQQLIEDFGLTHDQVATRVGKSRSAVTNTLRLMQLPGAIQQLVADGRLSAGHARALLGSDDRAFQEHLARRTIAEGLSVRFVEEAVRDREGITRPTPSPSPQSGSGDGARSAGASSPDPLGRPMKDAALLELERLLADHLDTSVTVSIVNKRGRISIDFADVEDLERIFYAMNGQVATNSS
jgi:ParB family transcriptional regulator, chromosome partitioning protein